MSEIANGSFLPELLFILMWDTVVEQVCLAEIEVEMASHRD